MTGAPRLPRVLVLDDEAAIARLCLRVLGAFRVQAESASSAAEAGARLAAERFDVLVTDVRLADGNGLDVARRFLRADPRARVLVLTGSVLPERALSEEGPRLRMLVKPFEIPDLRAAIAEALAAAAEAR